MTLARMIKLYKVPSELKLASKGLREMEDTDKDVNGVHELFGEYMRRFDMVPDMTVEEVRHQFVSGRGVGDVDAKTRRRDKQVVWTYVVEVPPLPLPPLIHVILTLNSPARSTPTHTK